MLNDLFTEEQKKDYTLLSLEGKRLFVQNLFKHNFAHFVYLLGYRDLGLFHKEVLELLGKGYKLADVPLRRLWLWARGHFKTSLITEAHSLYLIVNNLDIRLLIVSNTLEIAKKILGNIRNQFIGNEDFRYFFKEFCPQPNKEGKIEFGTTEYFTISNRTKNFKEPTCMCAGIGTNLTGLHFDFIKIDDLVTKDSVSNDSQIQASKDYYSSLRQLYDNPILPREDIVGTTYHFNDLYSDICKHDDFQKSFYPAFIDGKVVFPERFTEEGLEKIKNDPSVGPYTYNAQYLLNPINPAEAKFRQEWWKEYDKLPEGLAEYICVDPASTQKKKSDYTVIERWGVSSEGIHYLLEGIRDKLTAYQRIDKLFMLAKNSKNLKWVNYEVLGGRHGDLEVIKERQIKERFYFQVKETKSTSSSKRDRIEQRLVGPFNAGVIQLPKTLTYRSEFDGKIHDFIVEYRLEFLQFPFTEHDDILDCHSQMFQEQLILGQKPKVEKKKIGWTADDWDRLYKKLDNYQRDNPLMTREQAIERLKFNRFQNAMRAR